MSDENKNLVSLVVDQEAMKRVLIYFSRVLAFYPSEEVTDHSYFCFLVDAYNAQMFEENKFDYTEYKDDPITPEELTADILNSVLEDWTIGLDFNALGKFFPDEYYTMSYVFSELVMALKVKKEKAAFSEKKKPTISRKENKTKETESNGQEYKESQKIVEKFLNGNWITSLFVTRPAKMFAPTYRDATSFGSYNISKNKAYAYITDNGKPAASFSYMTRPEAFQEWVTEQISAYAYYLKSNEKSTEADEELDFVENLLFGKSKKETTASEKDWYEGVYVDSTFVGPNIPGVVLRIDLVEFSVSEMIELAKLIKLTEENYAANKDAFTTPESLTMRGMTIKLPRARCAGFVSIDHNTYDLDLVNIDKPASELVDKIASVMSKPPTERPDLLSCLFYGPPGSGKSLLANYLGERLGLKVIKKTYADLQSMYVGEGEKELKAAFEEASNQNAILLIDEIDSMAGNRATADRNYEKTFVNQLLTELEDFKGIFIATSNHMDNMDPAIMRRLYLKLQFKFLAEEQVEHCFKLYFPKLKGSLRLARGENNYLSYLTPGDFKAVREALAFEDKVNIARVREALAQEVSIKKKTMSDVIAMEVPKGYDFRT